MTRKKSLWLRWRLFANKHNNRLLYGMMGLMFSAQLILIYKHLKGERVHCKYNFTIFITILTTRITRFLLLYSQEYREKTSWSRVKNQRTQPTHGTENRKQVEVESACYKISVKHKNTKSLIFRTHSSSLGLAMVAEHPAVYPSSHFILHTLI